MESTGRRVLRRQARGCRSCHTWCELLSDGRYDGRIGNEGRGAKCASFLICLALQSAKRLPAVMAEMANQADSPKGFTLKSCGIRRNHEIWSVPSLTRIERLSYLFHISCIYDKRTCNAPTAAVYNPIMLHHEYEKAGTPEEIPARERSPARSKLSKLSCRGIRIPEVIRPQWSCSYHRQ